MPYIPSQHTVSAKPIGISQSVPTDARTYYYDSTNFKYRPYTSIIEVNSYLDSNTKRTGHFSVIINNGGTLLNGVITGGINTEYWYKDGIENNNLIIKAVDGDTSIVTLSNIVNASRKGDTIYNVLDEDTGELVTYNKTTTWITGKPIDDDLVDYALYIKVGTEYFVREHDPNVINVKWLGLNSNNELAGNEIKLNNFISKLPGNSTLSFYFPSGTYRFSKLPDEYNSFDTRTTCIKTYGSKFTFFGDGPDNSILTTGAGAGMFTFVIGNNTIKELGIYASAKDPLDGRILDNEGVPLYPTNDPRAWHTDPGAYDFCGIHCFGQATIHNVNVGGFSGNGLFIYGDPGTHIPYPPRIMKGTKVNATTIILDDPNDAYFVPNSGYLTYINIGGLDHIYLAGVYYPQGQLIPNNSTSPGFETLANGHYTFTVYSPGPGLIADNGQITGICNFDGNGACGIYIAGADGNQWSIIGTSVRENGHWGIDDNSFLGTHFFGCHGSANGKNFRDPLGSYADTPYGAFATHNLNARSTWIGCYTEEGNQGPDYYERHAVVLGGIHAAGVTGSGFFYAGQDHVFPELNFGKIQVRNKGLDFNFNNETWRFGTLRGDEYPGAEGPAKNVLGFSRTLYEGGRGILDFYPDGHVESNDFRADNLQVEDQPVGHRITTLSQLDTDFPNKIISPGTTFINKKTNLQNPSKWVCVTGGRIGTTNATIPGITAAQNGPTVTLTAGHPFILGDYITIDGLDYRLSAQDNPNGFYTDPLPFMGTNGGLGFPTTYAKITFRPEGTGIGILSQRPTATPDLKEFLYYSTDTNTISYCNGTTWNS